MSQVRQLAAIMFTDIVGYTTLMGEDEQLAIELLEKNRRIQAPLIEQFGGTWIKEIGDCVLASFSTVFDAVMCAGTIQQAAAQIPSLQLRVGIHLGDVIFENNDVFGDGVNIASRLQTIAKAGGIYISESVYNSIHNKKGITANFLREEMLKNVRDPVKVYEVFISVADGALEIIKRNFPSKDRLKPKSAPLKSIAVMPFVNMSNDPEQEYFSEGIAEEILNSLTHVKDLKVAGRSSTFQFKGKNVDLREVAEKLNVRTILEGSVRKQGTHLRITAQLINANEGFHLWSERYDREMDDLFAIQDEIALAITEKLKITLLEEEKAIIEKNPTEDREAYDLYLKGRFYLNKRGAAVRKALQFFQQAVEKDPTFALAYTGMADVHCILALYSSIPAHLGMPKARQYAEEAIRYQSGLAEAYSTLAFISIFYDWNWAEARNGFKKVFDISPNYAPARYWFSYYLSFVEGRFEEAIQEAKKAEILEPFEPVPHHISSMMLLNAGRYQEALEASKTSIELDPNFFPAYRSLGLSYAGLKLFDKAIIALEKAVTLSGRHPLPMVELSWVYSLAGRIADAQQLFDEFLNRSGTEFISPMFLCCCAYFSQHRDKALEYVEQAFQQRESTFPCIKVYDLYSFIREDEKFQPYITKMNFPAN